MGGQGPEKTKKHICAGLLAHVDSGKTTLSEGMLYVSGSIRTLGRVDHGDAFLDTDRLERARGITIFSKQARLVFEETEITLLDTPGHVDFSAEMERTLQVLDYAVLVVSGADGVQGHTLTLWKLLARYKIPVFVFVNKMDQPVRGRKELLALLKERLDERCVDFSPDGDREDFLENIAVCEESLLNRYLEEGTLEEGEIGEQIAKRHIFPCYFGSALKLDGVEELLRGISRYAVKARYPDTFGAKVFKISRDSQGNRLTFMKLTGGSIKVKDVLAGREAGGDGDSCWEEKVNQIRLYSGARFETTGQAEAGSICAVTGLTKTYAGQGLGAEEDSWNPVLSPVMSYQVILPEGCKAHELLPKLQQLEEEEPLLNIFWNEQVNEIHAQLMGQVQIDVVKALIEERFGVPVSFGAGNIVYKETIAEPVYGAGHFEPLRHYAEVHLLLEPGEAGSGITAAASCSEDLLDKNWQRLVVTHLEERAHKGVLGGFPITDIKITLVAGRAHQKHTEGGDFRQATYRAVRQGLMKAKSILLEPYYDFRLEIPAGSVGRAMSDIQRMCGTFDGPLAEGESAVLKGRVPAAGLGDYQNQVASYTRGMGKLSCTMRGYEPCHNQEEVLASLSYDPELDMDNPADSVFCSHGAGFVVPWDQADEYMHVGGKGEQAGYRDERTGQKAEPSGAFAPNIPRRQEKPGEDDGKGNGGEGNGYSGSLEADKELEEIFYRTYGGKKKQPFLTKPGNIQEERREKNRMKERTWESREPAEEYLLVDGYNVIFSWEELKGLAEISLDGARHRLMDILCNYQGFKKCHLILVFDAYRVEGHASEVLTYHNIHVVYTKEAETADQYIEKTVHRLGKRYHVTVATSDGLEQVIILGQGGLRMSAAELLEEIERTNRTIREEYLDKPRKKENLLLQYADDETAAYLKKVTDR